MYKIEAEIKKKTIISFVKIIKKLPYLSIENINTIADQICSMIDDEVDQKNKEHIEELDDIF